MNESEDYIESIVPSLLSARMVKAETDRIGGVWRLDQIIGINARPRNVFFVLLLRNDGNRWLKVTGRVNRATVKFSDLEVEESN